MLKLSRLFVVLLLLALLLLRWPQGGTATELPPLRIVCEVGDKVVRCPAHCVAGAGGEPDCRCQDFYYRRGEEPLTFSHSLCR